MSDDAVTCQFVFTTEEFRQALSCYRRHGPGRWMWPVLFIFIFACFVFSVTMDASNPAHANAAPGSKALTLFLNAIPLIFFIGVMIYAFSFKSANAFKKGSHYNEQMNFTFSDAGVALRTQLVESNLSWEIYARIIESKGGFMLFHKGSRLFNWLPKSGFDSPLSVDRAREIFRRNVNDSKKLFPAASSTPA